MAREKKEQQSSSSGHGIFSLGKKRVKTRFDSQLLNTTDKPKPGVASTTQLKANNLSPITAATATNSSQSTSDAKRVDQYLPAKKLSSPEQTLGFLQLHLFTEESSNIDDKKILAELDKIYSRDIFVTLVLETIQPLFPAGATVSCWNKIFIGLLTSKKSLQELGEIVHEISQNKSFYFGSMKDEDIPHFFRQFISLPFSLKEIKKLQLIHFLRPTDNESKKPVNDNDTPKGEPSLEYEIISFLDPTSSLSDRIKILSVMSKKKAAEIDEIAAILKKAPSYFTDSKMSVDNRMQVLKTLLQGCPSAIKAICKVINEDPAFFTELSQPNRIRVINALVEKKEELIVKQTYQAFQHAAEFIQTRSIECNRDRVLAKLMVLPANGVAEVMAIADKEVRSVKAGKVDFTEKRRFQNYIQAKVLFWQKAYVEEKSKVNLEGSLSDPSTESENNESSLTS